MKESGLQMTLIAAADKDDREVNCAGDIKCVRVEEMKKLLVVVYANGSNLGVHAANGRLLQL